MVSSVGVASTARVSSRTWMHRRSSIFALLLLAAPTFARNMLYDAGEWSSLWWLPTQTTAGGAAQPGTQLMGDVGIPHLIFVPSGTPPKGGFPLIVFLHGQGESSPSPLPNVALQGPPQSAGRHPSTTPFAVLSPQKPMMSQFFDEEVASGIATAIRHYLGQQPLDPRRVYLTGISQGGIGTWGLASDAKYNELFAAIAPVCGGFPNRPNKRADVLKSTPVWAFHGENDSILPVSMSDESVAALRKSARTAEVKYDRIPEARGTDPSWAAAGVPDMEGHASWVHAYYPPGTRVGENPPLYDWLLKHHRPA